jgi:hypothetical protein
LAIAAQPVEARCASGIGSADTNADGTYTITVSGGVLPCTLRVTTASGEVLHSLALGTGSTAQANITPISQLIVARLAGSNPADFFAGFDGAAAGSLNEESVQAASAAIVETLRSAGIDLSGFGNLLTAELVAATGDGSQGNAFDQALDALQATISSSGTTLAALTKALARTSPAAATTPTGIASLPADLLLRPAASDCPALRSGTYRTVVPGAPVGSQFRTFGFDAPTMTATSEGGAAVWTSAGEECTYEFALGDQGRRAKVSPAGLIVMAAEGGDGHIRPVLNFPEQTIPLAELAGTWITLEWVRDGEGLPLSLLSADITFDSAGKITAMTDCGGLDLADCASEQPDGALVVNANGGFDGTGNDLGDVRAFAYRSGSGDLMLMLVGQDGSFALATKKYARGMPQVGQVTGGWSMIVTPSGLINTSLPVLEKATHKVATIDASAGSYVRINDATGASQTLTINSPREGYVHRAPATGSAEVAMLGLRGMNLTLFGTLNRPDPWAGFYGFNVDLR